MSLVGLVGAVLVGTAFGYGAQRGAFCMSSGLRGVMAGEWTKVKALGLAVAVQLLLLPIVPQSAVLLKRLAGGLGLGAVASIASRCTVGQGLTGLALLAPSSAVVMVSTLAGTAAEALIARRLEALSRAAAVAPFATTSDTRGR